MTTETHSELEKRDVSAPARDANGRLLPGHTMGRPKKGNSLRDLLRRQPLKDKKALVAIAYELALDGEVAWAEWIAKHSGEGHTTGEAAAQVNVERGVFFLAMPGTTQE